ncbi:unnamed protein product [Brassica oleracea]
MSMIQAFSLLKNVKPYKQGWRVQVMLLHSWRQKTNYGGDTLEMIFTDKTRVKYGLLEEHLQQTNNPNMVCMIRFAKIGFYRGNVQITNAFDSSLICFDPDLPECLALKNNMPNDEFALALTDTKNDKRPIKDQIDDWNDVGIKSISEIIMATQDCKIICSIESIDTDWSWFIFGHVSRNRRNKRCLRIKSKEGGNLPPNEKPLFWCTSCRVNTTTVTPQFKLHLIVKDDTSTCKLMLLDSVAKDVVGCNAKDIWDGFYEEIEDPDILPQTITYLVGKSICFGLTLGSENVKNGSDIFLVSQVWSGDNILQIESNSEPITHVSLTEKSEANSSEGSSTPFSKRKEKDQVDQTSTSKKICTKVVKMEKIKDDELNRKQGFPPIQRGDSTQQTERITRRKQNSGNLVQVKRSQNQKSIRTLDVPVSTVFKRLFHGVGYIHTDAVSPNVNQGKQLTPCTPRNIIKCATSMDCGTEQASYGNLQRSCLTSVAYKAGIRKRPRSGLQDKTNICSFMDRLDETSGEESEEDGNAVAYDSDFEDRFDENFKEDLDCSSQENTDEESDPEIEVVDLTVTKEPNSIPARNRVKSLASLFEEAFRATEKPSKKTGPKEDAYIDEGDAIFTCTYCGAIMWFGERLNRRLKTRNPKFALCCMQGQVQLPLLKQPPEVLQNLLNGDDKLSEHFQRNTRAYNMVFSFTSLGGKVDRAVRKGKGPNMLVLQGENYHLIGSL